MLGSVRPETLPSPRTRLSTPCGAKEEFNKAQSHANAREFVFPPVRNVTQSQTSTGNDNTTAEKKQMPASHLACLPT